MAQGLGGDGLQRAAHAGLDQRAVGVVVVDAHHGAAPTVAVGVRMKRKR
jgi:hypothetical protein